MSVIALTDLENLPRISATEIKKLGWRRVMAHVDRDGQVLVTRHGKPEAVILSLSEHESISAKSRDKAKRDNLALEKLRREFDKRLACLNAPDAGEKIASLFEKPLSLNGKVFTGKASYD